MERFVNRSKIIKEIYIIRSALLVYISEVGSSAVAQ